ncbi:MAG: 2-oxoacid:acceptor oxidoreductase family protein, partial [Dehalococcoidia bacterium]
MQKEFLFSGRGGQGLGVMGRVLALAAVLEGKEVASSASYGGEVTGGLSESEAVISDEKIDFPAVLNPDVLIVLSQDSYDKYVPVAHGKALIFYDPSFVNDSQSAENLKLISVHAAEKAVENFGRGQFANMVMLGTVAALTHIVRPESLLRDTLARHGDAERVVWAQEEPQNRGGWTF